MKVVESGVGDEILISYTKIAQRSGILWLKRY